jgi:crotonobetainyl-CoA:carnitine CoA-transferase CaiB-like acyl-CoA transferase
VVAFLTIRQKRRFRPGAARRRGGEVLSGFRILELGDESGWLAGKILAELGAQVWRLEPPGGDPARRELGPDGRPRPGLRWLALNTSKRSAVLDLESAGGRETFRRLARSSDAVLESGPAGWLDERGVGFEALRREAPALVWCSLTPFGGEGPYARHRASDLTAVAMGGNLALTGDPDRPPVRCSLPTAYLHAGPEAALGLVTALYARERTGRGQRVDVSLQECQLQTLVGAPGQHALSKRPFRRAGARTGRTREIWPARDGFVSFGLRGGPARASNLAAAVGWMAEHGRAPAWLREIDWSAYDPAALSEPELARLEEAFGAFFRGFTLAELYGEALRRRILLAPCNDARAVAGQEQLRARAFFVRLEHPGSGAAAQHPARFARSPTARLGLSGPAPALGPPARDLLEELEGCRPKLPATQGESELGGVFAGLRVLEFGSGAAGPLATRYLAEQGARVVRVESRRRPDFLRIIAPDPSRPGDLEASPMFALLNAGKESVSLDLSRPEGAQLARRLVAWADVVVENFAPGVLSRLGVDLDALCEARPELVAVSSCLFGQTGPQRGYPGFGGQGSAIAGFNHLTGWPDREPVGPYGTITDTLSPRYVALLVAAALLDRRRGGRGHRFDVSQIETGVYSLSETIVRYSARGEVACRLGNRDPEAAPHGVYPCRGEDRWIAIAVFGDDEWRALAGALGSPAWTAAPELAGRAGRLREADALDRRLAEATREHEAYALMERLQAAGVRAGVVQTPADLLADPQLAWRGHFRRLPHPRLGPLACEHSGIRLEGHPPFLARAGPLLGEHNAEVLGGALGLPPGEIERLAASGVLA